MLFPPEEASGAGAPNPAPAASPTSAGASSPPAGASPPAGDTQAFSTPADEYKKQYEDLQGKYKEWEQFGTPQQVKEAIDWARARAAEIQAGKLRMVEDKPPASTAPTQDGPPANWDDLSLTEQREWLREDAKRTVRAERDALKAELEAPLKQQLQTIGMQQQIWMQATKLAQETGVPFDEAMAESMRIAQLDSNGLLRLAFESKARPAQMEREIERRVNEALAKQKQEQENAELAMVMGRGAPRYATEPAKDPQEQRQQARMTVLRKIREEVRNRGRGAA